jgi:hypothetical protein
MTIPKVVREHAKAIAAFVATFVGNAIVSMIRGETAIPQTKDEWTQYLLTSIGSALVVWLQPAKVTDKQVEKDPTLIRIEPPAEISAPTPGTIVDGTTYQTNTGETRTMGQAYVPPTTGAVGSPWVA